jgi:hypothetical protein
MTDTPQQDQVKPDADTSVPQLLHPDPAEFRIITRHAAESPYVSITDSGLSTGDIKSVWKKLRKYENRRDRMINMLKTAWAGIWIGLLFLSFPALIISVVAFGMDGLMTIAWFTAGSLIPSGYYLHKKRLAVKAAQKVNGTVVGYSKHINNRRRRFYALKVEYQYKVGIKHIIISKTSSAIPSKKIGEQVFVLIHADGTSPELFLSDDLYMPYYIWFFAGVIAILFLLGPYLLDWFYPLP